MINTVTSLCLVMLFGALVLNLVRIIKGPSMADRVIAADVVFLDLVAIAIVYSIRLNTPFYFDLVLVFSLLGFVATVAFAKYLGQGRIVE